MPKKRTFTHREKLDILKEASERGVKATLVKFGISPSTYNAWRKKFNEMGAEGTEWGMTPEELKRIRELEKENIRLREIIAEKEEEGREQDELLKKKWAAEKKRNA